MSDIYTQIAENDALIATTQDRIKTLESATNAHLSGEKGHVKSYKIADREIQFSVDGFHKEIERLNSELNKLKAEARRLAYLQSLWECRLIPSTRIVSRF